MKIPHILFFFSFLKPLGGKSPPAPLWRRPWSCLNPRPTMPFFVTWFTKGGGCLPPSYELEIDGPKVWLIVWYHGIGRVSSFHWYQNHENRSTYDVTMTFSNMVGLKKRIFSENRPKLKKKINFFAMKVPNIGISPGFLLIKKGKGVSNVSWKF